MTDLANVPALDEPAPDTTRRSLGGAPLADRFPLYAAGEIGVAELSAALNQHGFYITAAPEGWFLDKIHAIALVRKTQPEEEKST